MVEVSLVGVVRWIFEENKSWLRRMVDCLARYKIGDGLGVSVNSMMLFSIVGGSLTLAMMNFIGNLSYDMSVENWRASGWSVSGVTNVRERWTLLADNSLGVMGMLTSGMERFDLGPRKMELTIAICQ